ncbi:MAG: ATP synthase F1 subunit delta [Fusobacteriaceae bacterium]
MVEKVGKRYADAIYDIAREMEIVLDVFALLKEVDTLYNKNPEFREFFQHPLVKKEDKLTLIEKIFSEKTEIEKNIVLYLVERGRIMEIKSILEEYKTLYYNENRIVDVKATFASEITDEQKKKLIEKIEKNTNKKVNLEFTIDTSLIGGAILKIGDKIIDGSIKTQLDNMAKGK